MKFIPGTKFINNTRTNTKFFKRGKLYILRNIKGSDDYVEYFFDVEREIVSVKFDTVKQADEWLSKIVV